MTALGATGLFVIALVVYVVFLRPLGRVLLFWAALVAACMALLLQGLDGKRRVS
jgi:Na+/H+ antiporter NhaD/arsenite permease-like protein